MMLRAGRSFVLPPGFKNSNFAYKSNFASGKTRVSLTSGVLAIADRTPSFVDDNKRQSRVAVLT